MPDGKVMVVLAIAGLLLTGGAKIGHGVKVAAQKTAHVVKHVVKHPVDSAKNGAINAPQGK